MKAAHFLDCMRLRKAIIDQDSREVKNLLHLDHSIVLWPAVPLLGSPLVVASKGLNLEIIREVFVALSNVEHGPPAETQSSLARAADKRNYEAFHQLLRLHSHVGGNIQDLQSLLYECIDTHNDELVRLCLKEGIPTCVPASPFHESPLHAAYDVCDETIVRILKEYGARETPFSAIASGDIAILKQCLETNEGSLRARWGNCSRHYLVAPLPIHLAVLLNKPDCVKLLLDFGASAKDETASGISASALAALSGNESLGHFNKNDWDFCTHVLVQEAVPDQLPPNPTSTDLTLALCLSIIGKRRLMAKYLLGLGVNVNCNLSPRSDWTPLGLAVLSDDSLVEHLLSLGSQIEPLPDKFKSALGIAIRFGLNNDTIVNALLEYFNGCPSTVYLNLAIKRHNGVLVKMLLKAGVDPNAWKEELEFSPLHMAVFYWKPGHEQMISTLLASGADPAAPDKVVGLTPVEYAHALAWPSVPSAALLRALGE